MILKKLMMLMWAMALSTGPIATAQITMSPIGTVKTGLFRD
jgi:hypothetical protein